MSNKKDLEVKAESKDLMTKQVEADWGNTQITSQDMVIPKILPLQHMSDKVKDKQGEYGEFRDTLSNELFGDLETPFEVLPFLMQKKWLEFSMIPQKNGGFKREYSGTTPIQDNPLIEGYNDDLPLRDEATKIERDRVLDFFVLIPGEIVTGTALPYVLSFRRTSLKAGQKLATQMYVKNKNAGKSPAAVVMEMSGKDKENDDGSFVVQDINPKRQATDLEVNEALKWFKVIKQSANVKVDESDFKKETPTRTNPAQETEF